MSVLIHPSSLSIIMGEPKSIDPDLMDAATLEIYKKKKKTDNDQALLAPLWEKTLSAGAKTYLTGLASQHVYGFKPSFYSKETAKGLRVEDQSIELYNHVNFTQHFKNTERRTDDILDGECDIHDEDSIVDIKSSWSLATFPATRAMAHDPAYEWQGRGYMRLWDKPHFILAFCMVSTPEEFLKYEDASLHLVDHIAPEMRVTVVRYARDADIESRIVAKCKAAQEFVERTIETIIAEHRYD